jgi:hypothetical protein
MIATFGDCGGLDMVLPGSAHSRAEKEVTTGIRGPLCGLIAAFYLNPNDLYCRRLRPARLPSRSFGRNIPQILLQLGHQLLEVGAVAERVEGRLEPDLVPIPLAHGNRPVQPFHRPGGLICPLGCRDP